MSAGRYLNSPEGLPIETPRDPDLAQPAGFGPGNRYWTHAGTVLIGDGQVMLVVPADEDGPERVVVAERVENVTVTRKPWWSLGMGLHLDVAGTKYTLEPEPLGFGTAATLGRVRRARAAAKDFEEALVAAQAGRKPASQM